MIPFAFLILTLGLFMPAQDNAIDVAFDVTVPAGTTGDVYVAGDLPAWGPWRAAGLKLTPSADGHYRGHIALPPGTTLQFKITRGFWTTEETTATGETIQNRTLVVPAADTPGSKPAASVEVTVAGWRDVLRRPRLEASGRIIRIADVHATRLGNDRPVLVLLPASYAASPKKRYPVIYAHDGQNLFASVVGGGTVDWNVDGTLDRITSGGGLAEAIVVGVYSNDDRMRELDPLDRGPDYADFLIHDLKPMIDKRFRTRPDRTNTMTMGSSMGGLISSYLALCHSDVFSAAACLSLHVIHPMQDESTSGAWLRVLETDFPKHEPVRLYIDQGTAGLDSRYAPKMKQLIAVLERNGFTMGRNLDLVVVEGADHNEAAWAARLERPLRFLLAGLPQRS